MVHKQATTPMAMLTPRFSQLHGGVRLFSYGANREPHAVNMQAGMLTSIEYPTGGATKLTYEPNDFYAVSQFDETDDYPYTVSSHGITESTFTLTQDAFVFLNFDLVNHMYSGNPNATGIMDNMTAVLEKDDGTDILKFIPSDTQMDGEPGGNNNVDAMKANVCVALGPGTYRIRTLHGGYTYLHLSLTAKYRNKILTNKKFAAGPRIKTIETYENKGGLQLKRKRFVYEKNSESTGRLIQKYQPFINTTDLLHKIMSSTEGGIYQPCCDVNSIINPITFPTPFHPPYYIQVRGSLIAPFGTSLQGNVVGYNEVSVVEENESGQNLGRTTYKYKNMPENYVGAFIPGMPTRRVIDNGQLTVEEFYNRGDILIKKRIHGYSKSDQTDLILGGMNTSFSPVGLFAKPGYPHLYAGNQVPYVAIYYELWSEWWRPTVTTETVYDLTGSNPITTTTTHEYTNAVHKLLTKTTQTTSSGQQLVTENKYPPDAPSGTETSLTTLNEMIAANIINPMIKQEVRLDGALIKGSINNYTVDVHGNVVASTVQELKTGEGTYETKLEFQKYDDKGRLLQGKSVDGIITSYIWSYNNDLPVVKAQNVDYNTLRSAVENAAGTTNLETFWTNLSNVTHANTTWNNFNSVLRNNVTLKDALIATYTHIPLIGITSETDPNGRTTYYEYDDFKRLKFIRNPKGEILKNYKYAYAND